MKIRKRHHCRHNAPIQAKFPYSVSVFWRRVNGIYGADNKEFSRKHPDLDAAVEGYEARRRAAMSVGRA